MSEKGAHFATSALEDELKPLSPGLMAEDEHHGLPF